MISPQHCRRNHTSDSPPCMHLRRTIYPHCSPWAIGVLLANARQRDSFQTRLSAPLRVRSCALISLPKCPLFKPRTSLSPLFISHHLSLPELIYFITLHSEFRAEINSLDTKAGPCILCLALTIHFSSQIFFFSLSLEVQCGEQLVCL